MTLNTSNKDLIVRRREAVGAMRLKGLSQREIVKGLPKYEPPIVGDDGAAFSLATVNSDLKALKNEWRKNAEAAIGEHMAAQLAALDQVERRGWSDGDMLIVLRAIALKMKLIGTDAPQKIEQSGEVNHRIVIEYIDAATTATLDASATSDQATG